MSPLLARSLARSSSLCSLTRSLSYQAPAPPVDLKYDVYNGPIDSQAKKGPLIICHGLLGSKRNWMSLGKVFAKQLERPVIALDLRNAGQSPHREQMDYAIMASDILHFCNKQSLKNVSLLGHSMGGKVAMTVALSPNLPKGLLSHLIVVDVSPIRTTLSSEFTKYIDGMIKIQNEGSAKSRKEAFERLQEYEQDPLIRHFLLTNLAQTHADKPIRFSVPLQMLRNSLPDIGWFPYDVNEASWDGPTLFVRGSKSNYIKPKHLDDMKQFFPNMRIETLEAGHWVHYEKPKEFAEIISHFIRTS